MALIRIETMELGVCQKSVDRWTERQIAFCLYIVEMPLAVLEKAENVIKIFSLKYLL